MAYKNITNLLPGTEHICFVVPGLFSPQECKALQVDGTTSTFHKAIDKYPTYYRNNDRLVADNPELAGQLYERVKPYLPEIVVVNKEIPAENGTWQLMGLNSRLRFCRYRAGQYFHRHLDGVHYRSATIQSKLTFMVYLNGSEDFEGGRTLFYKTRTDTTPWAAYTPVQGDLIVFDHNVWHEGEELGSGEKYVLRSDILYQKSTAGHSTQPFSGHLGYIWKLLPLDAGTLISGGRDKTINVWTATGQLKQQLTGHHNSILCLEQLSKDVFISGSRDRQIIVWKKNGDGIFSAVRTIGIHSAVVLSLCRLSASVFASAGGDNTIHICNTEGLILKTLTGHTNWVWAVIKLDDKRIASCSEDGCIIVWDVTTGAPLHTFTTGCAIISLLYNRSTRQLISGNLDGEITLRNLGNENDTEVKTIAAHTGLIRTLMLIDDTLLVSGGEDNAVKIWHLATGSLLSTHWHNNFVQSVAVNGNKLMSASYDGMIMQWEVERSKLLAPVNTVQQR